MVEKEKLVATLQQIENRICTWKTLSTKKYFSLFADGDKGEKIYKRSLATPRIPHENGMVFLYPENYYEVPRLYSNGKLIKWDDSHDRRTILFKTAVMMAHNAHIANPYPLAVMLLYEYHTYYQIDSEVIGFDEIAEYAIAATTTPPYFSSSTHPAWSINKKWFSDNNVCMEITANGGRKLNTNKAVEYARKALKGRESDDDKILVYMIAEPTISIREIAEKLGVSAKTVKRKIAKMEGVYIRREGSARGGRWVAIPKAS